MRVVVLVVEFNKDTIEDTLKEVASEVKQHSDSLGGCGDVENGDRYDYTWHDLDEPYFAEIERAIKKDQANDIKEALQKVFDE